jgi:hypothetical protein
LETDDDDEEDAAALVTVVFTMLSFSMLPQLPLLTSEMLFSLSTALL